MADRVIYTNTMAFKKALFASNVKVEQRREIRVLREAYDRMIEEQRKRSNNSLMGTMVGGAIGFAFGGPSGANIGAKAGSLVGMNYNNESYTSLMGKVADYQGKFATTSGFETYDKMLKEGKDLEDQQDKLNTMGLFTIGKSLMMTDWKKSLNIQGPDADLVYKPEIHGYGKEDNWFQMSFGEKMKHMRESKQPFNMKDFIKGMKEGEKSIPFNVSDEDEFVLNTGDYFDNQISDDIRTVLSFMRLNPEDYSKEQIDLINTALSNAGLDPIDQNDLNFIKNLDQNIGVNVDYNLQDLNLSEDILNVFNQPTYPEDFEW